MSHMSREFPAFSFPGSSTKTKGHTVVDYGLNDVLDIDVNNQKVETTSRKCVRKLPGDQYKPTSCCFPLKNPNEARNGPVFEEMLDSWISPHAQNPYIIGRTFKTSNNQHLDKLFADHPDLIIGNLISEMTNSQINLLSRNFHPLKFSFDIWHKLHARSKPPENCREYFKQSWRMQKNTMSRFSSYNRKKNQVARNYLKDMDGLLDALFEIPRDLLLDYLDESHTDRIELLTENYHLGNCLAACDNFLMYPQGKYAENVYVYQGCF